MKKIELKYKYLITVVLLLMVFLSACKPEEYEISGTVVDQAGNNIEGIKIQVSGRHYDATIEDFDENGAWSATVKGTVTLTPVHEDYYFEPEKIEVTEVSSELNFVANKLIPYDIGGRIVDEDGNAISQVSLEIKGSNFEGKVDEIFSDGSWFETVKGNVTIKPVHDFYHFEPSELVINETESNLDFTAKPPRLIIDFDEVEIDEEESMVGPLKIRHHPESFELTTVPNEVISGDRSLKIYKRSLPDTSGNPWHNIFELLLVPDYFAEGTKFKYSYDVRILREGESYQTRSRLREGDFEQEGDIVEIPGRPTISGIGVHNIQGIVDGSELSPPLKAQITFRIQPREEETEENVPFIIDNIVIERIE